MDTLVDTLNFCFDLDPWGACEKSDLSEIAEFWRSSSRQSMGMLGLFSGSHLQRKFHEWITTGICPAGT